MHIHTTLRQANHVLTGVLSGLRKLEKKHKDRIAEVAVVAYKNGRENGYGLNVYFEDIEKANFYLAFSECRGSDQIVVYKGKFDYDGIPTEETYAARVYFDQEAYDKAAKYIINSIKKS